MPGCVCDRHLGQRAVGRVHAPGADIVPGDTNGTADVFVGETATGLISRESVRTDGPQSTGAVVFPSGSPSIDNLAIDDSGGVVFQSDAADLTPEIVNMSTWNLFRRGLTAGRRERDSRRRTRRPVPRVRLDPRDPDGRWTRWHSVG